MDLLTIGMISAEKTRIYLDDNMVVIVLWYGRGVGCSFTGEISWGVEKTENYQETHANLSFPIGECLFQWWENGI